MEELKECVVCGRRFEPESPEDDYCNECEETMNELSDGKGEDHE